MQASYTSEKELMPYLTYVLLTDGNFNEEFSINSTTGQLTVSKPLQGGSDYQLSIEAKDIYIPPTIAFTLVSFINAIDI